jgi:hypothetical protein
MAAADNALIALGDEDRLRQARIIRDMAAARFPRSQWRFAALDPASAPAQMASCDCSNVASSRAGGRH